METLMTVKLKPGEENRLLGGHPWVFSNELEGAAVQAEPGCLAAAVDSRGRPLGVGFYNPHSLIAWRLVSRQPQDVDEAFFRGRLETALTLRQRLYPGARSFRLCFGESDGLPGLVVDKYEDILSVQVLSAGIESRLELVSAALRGLLSPKGIFLHNEHPARALEGLKTESRVLWGEVPERVGIEEDGLKFLIPLREGQKTGFYFDQRENRALTAAFSRGRKVLDLHCYTGGFALHAARGGAAKVLGLDSSSLAVDLAREGAKLNGLDGTCEFDEGDAEEVLGAFAFGRQPYEPDLIVLDPPSFAQSKKHLMKALRAYVKLNSMALRALRPGGMLAMSTCSHHVGRESFVGMLREAAAKAHRSLRLVELRTQAKDHPILLAMPETEYLHFALLEVAG